MPRLTIPSHFREENPEVFYFTGGLAKIGNDDLSFLKEQASRNPSGRCRLCFHSDPGAPLHEMLIVHHRDTYVRPHLHVDRSESLQVVEGEALALFFSAEGQVEDAFKLALSGSDGRFFYHLPGNTYHALQITSEWLVFSEVTTGPFDPTKTFFPDWAPEPGDISAIDSFKSEVQQLAGPFLRQE